MYVGMEVSTVGTAWPYLQSCGLGRLTDLASGWVGTNRFRNLRFGREISFPNLKIRLGAIVAKNRGSIWRFDGEIAFPSL
jgi:hypothetical protein